MKTAAISGVLIAALAAGAVTVPSAAAAQSYRYAPAGYGDCRKDGTAGAVIGGIAGALLGSSVAPHHGNRAGGAAIGGLAGALIGSSIAKSSSCSTYSQGYGYDGYGYGNRYSGYGYDGQYARPDYRTTYSYRDSDSWRRDHGRDWHEDHDGWRDRD